MKCCICDGEIKNKQSAKLFGSCICSLCLYDIGKVNIDSVFYDFYVKKIKNILKNASII